MLDHANCAIDENTESDHDSRENQQEISPEEEAPERHEDGEPQADINEFLQPDNDEPMGSHEGAESEEDYDDTDNLPKEQLYKWDRPNILRILKPPLQRHQTNMSLPAGSPRQSRIPSKSGPSRLGIISTSIFNGLWNPSVFGRDKITRNFSRNIVG